MKGASPPTVREVLRKGTKGRTNSTPSAKFDYSNIRWNNTARTMKSKFDMILEDPPSPSQFNLHTMIESDDASENAEFSNISAPVLEPKLRTSSRIPSRTMDVGKGQLIPHPRFQNSRSTSLYTNPTDSQPPRECLRSVKPTDKKFACGHNKHCICPIKSNSSCINKIAERQVQFPRSNRTDMCVGELSDRHGNTVKQWEKVQNSTDRILCRTRIETHQSAASDFSQSASPLINQSQLRMYALTDQSQARNPRSFCYKSRCRSQFVSSVSLKTENSTIRNTLSSVGFEWRHRSNTPV